MTTNSKDVSKKPSIRFKIRFNNDQVYCLSCDVGDTINELYRKIYEVSGQKIETLAFMGVYPQHVISPSSLTIEEIGLTNNCVLIALSEIKHNKSLIQGQGNFIPIQEIDDSLEWQQLLKNTSADYLILCFFYTSKIDCATLIDQYESLNRDSNFNSRVLFYKINADKNPSCVYTDGSMMLPKFIFYRNQQIIDVYSGNDVEQLKSCLRWNAFRQPLSSNQISISGKLDQLPWSRMDTDEYYDPR